MCKVVKYLGGRYLTGCGHEFIRERNSPQSDQVSNCRICGEELEEGSGYDFSKEDLLSAGV